MKKKVLSLVLAAGILAMTGCYGTFTLTKKVYNWNGGVGDKVVNSVVFWVLNIVPVYGACTFIDAVVLNTIEFWTGTNPLAIQSTEKSEKIVVSGDKTYRVLAGNNEISITQTAGPGAGQSATLVFDEASTSWLLSQDGQLTTLASLDGDLVKLHYPDGKTELREIK